MKIHHSNYRILEFETNIVTFNVLLIWKNITFIMYFIATPGQYFVPKVYFIQHILLILFKFMKDNKSSTPNHAQFPMQRNHLSKYSVFESEVESFKLSQKSLFQPLGRYISSNSLTHKATDYIFILFNAFYLIFLSCNNHKSE